MNTILPAFRSRAGFLLSKLNEKSLIALYCILFITCISAKAQVSGRIYKDYNANGVWDSTATHLDEGRAGTVVRVYDNKGILKGSTTTNADGKYLIPNVSGNLRLQVTLPPYYTDGFITSANKNSQSSVQFIKAPATNVDLGMNFGDDYCGNDPKMIVSCYAVGIGGQSEDAIVTLPYNASGTDPSVKQMMNSPMQSMGCLWGGAYQKTSGSFFTGAFMKRHAAFGEGGPSAIYVTKNADKPNIAQSEIYIKLSDFGYDVGQDPHPRGTVNNDYNFQMDTGSIVYAGKRYTATDLVGKMSLGDIDLTTNGEYMFVSNLWNCKIYRIHIGNPHKPGSAITAADIVEYDIPHPWDETPVTGVGLARPFGFCPRQGKMYVGIVCDASISQNRDDLKARIYEMDYDNPAIPNWKLLIEFSLNYIKGFATGELQNESNKWYPWFREGEEWWSPGLPDFLKTKYISYPMPMLSDIEIDADGSMVVAFMDRFAHQTRLAGTDAYGNHHGTFGFDPRVGGDVLRIGNCNGVWTLENNGSVCGGTPSAGKDNNEGIGGGEFYVGDGNAPLGHNELSVGSLAFLPGSREMVLASTDPIGPYSAGMTWLSSVDGRKNRAYELLEGLSALIADAPVGYGKAASIGDVNMVCKLSPLEIGNRLWRDDNGNGIQEAGEPGIADVLLELVNDQNMVVGKDTTDINGVYSFNHYNVVDTLGVLKFDLLGPQANSHYSVKVKGKVGVPAPTAAPTIKGGRVAAYSGTSTNDGGKLIDDSVLGNANAGSGPDQDLLDSDGVLTGNDGEIDVITLDIGQSNHSYDFAYCPLPKVDLVVQKATCDPVKDIPLNNASIIFSNTQFSHKVGYSSGTTYTGPLFDNAKDINSTTTFTIDSLPGSTTDQVYTVRVFNASDDCARDIQVTIEGTVCVPCQITGTANAALIVVYNNGTPSDPTDDYFTVSVQANATNSGAADLYEIVINANPDGTGGTVLNTGGTYYNQPVKVGLGKELKANSQAIKLTVRDAVKVACVNSVSVQADPFRLECKPDICTPLKTVRTDN
jgi:SdrD B-like domain